MPRSQAPLCESVHENWRSVSMNSYVTLVYVHTQPYASVALLSETFTGLIWIGDGVVVAPRNFRYLPKIEHRSLSPHLLSPPT
jgi:hypothetical protein